MDIVEAERVYVGGDSSNLWNYSVSQGKGRMN